MRSRHAQPSARFAARATPSSAEPEPMPERGTGRFAGQLSTYSAFFFASACLTA